MSRTGTLAALSRRAAVTAALLGHVAPLKNLEIHEYAPAKHCDDPHSDGTAYDQHHARCGCDNRERQVREDGITPPWTRGHHAPRPEAKISMPTIRTVMML